MVIGTYFVTTVLLLPGALFATPEDYGCTDCPENKLLIVHEPAVASVSVVVVAAPGDLRAGVHGARPACGAGARRAAVAGDPSGAGRRAGPDRDAEHQPPRPAARASRAPAIEAVTVTGLAAFGLVPYIVLTALARVRLERGGALSALLARLAETPGPGELRDALASALGDPTLMLAYPLPGSDRYVDAARRPT